MPTKTIALEPRSGPPIPIYVCNLKSEVAETMWRVRAALDGAANANIYGIAVEPESSPPLPDGWDLRQ